MKRAFLMVMVCHTLAACGLGETAVSVAGAGVSQAEQAKEARRIEASVKQRLDAAAVVDANSRQTADVSAE